MEYAVSVSAGFPTEPSIEGLIGPVPQYTTEPQPDGSALYCNVRARDGAGQWSRGYASIGPFLLDATPPVAPMNLTSTTHEVGVPSNQPVITVTWSPAADLTSGILGYGSIWSTDPTTIPSTSLTDAVTSITSPTLTDATWWFHVRAVDLAGNRSVTSRIGPFLISALAPQVPTLTSASHASGSCSNDCTVEVTWSNPTLTIGYSYEWNADPASVPDSAIDSGTPQATSPCLGTGHWYLHVRASNAANDWSDPAHFGPFAIDLDPPENPTQIASSSHAPGVWSRWPSVSLAWSGASDVACAVGGYSLAFDRQEATVPDVTPELTGTQTDSPELPDGAPWFAHLRALDTAGNPAVGAVHHGPLWIDATAPTAMVVTPNGGDSLAVGSAITLDLRAEDALSGVRSVTVQASLDGGLSWTVPLFEGPALDGPVLWRLPEHAVAAAMVRLLVEDRAGNRGFDSSDAAFAIVTERPPTPPPPIAYSLGANVPNPFNPATTIPIELPAAGVVRLDVLDLRGRVVAELLDAQREAGRLEVVWDGRDSAGVAVPSGVYLYRLRSGGFVASRKLTALR